MLRSMTHQEFRALLRTVLQSFLNCIEGLQTLNGNITEVTKGTRFVVRAYIATGCSFILPIARWRCHQSSRQYTILCLTRFPPP